MSIQGFFEAQGLSPAVVAAAGVVGLLVLMLAGAMAAALAFRTLGRRLDAQAALLEELRGTLAELRDEAAYRAPARAAVAALVVSSRDENQALDRIEARLRELSLDWAHVERLSDEAYEILAALRGRANGAGSPGAGPDAGSSPARHSA